MSGRFLLRKVRGGFDAVRRVMRSVVRAVQPPSIAHLALALALWCVFAPILAPIMVAKRAARTIAVSTLPNALLIGSMLVNPFIFGAGVTVTTGTVTVDHTKVSATLSNFPVWVTFTDNSFKGTGSGGTLTSVNNLAFYSDSGLTTLLKFEREVHDLTSGLIGYWVKIPSLSSSVDTVFYIAIDPSNSTDRSDAANVYDSNYSLVWHLGDGSTVSVTDSTSNANNGSLFGSPSATTGKLYGGAGFVSSGTAITRAETTSLQFTNTFTIQAWYNPSSFGDYRTVTAKGSGTQRDFCLDTEITTGKPRFFLTQGVNNFKGFAASTGLSTGTWYKLDATYDGTTMRLFRNGVADGTASVTGNTDVTGQQMAVGKLGINIGAQGAFADGTIDEVRISKGAARSVDWFLTEYHNQNSPSTFYTLT